MKKSAGPIRIAIPNPCFQEWDAMQQTEKGKFCGSCQKEVIDFSALTDKELYQYFGSVKTIPCGRFHNSQLNIAISKTEQPSRIHRFYKHLVALIALWALKNNTVTAQSKTETTAHPVSNKSATDSLKSIATISGTIKSADGTLLCGAMVFVDNNPIAVADKNGCFKFEIENQSKKTSILSFTDTGFVTVVRSYHPTMQSTSYNITLEQPQLYSSHTAGTPVVSGILAMTIQLPQQHLASQVRQDLATMATSLRNYPNSNIDLVGYGTTQKEIRSTNRSLTALKDYFVEREGIADERIFIKVIKRVAGIPLNSVTIEEHMD